MRRGAALAGWSGAHGRGLSVVTSEAHSTGSEDWERVLTRDAFVGAFADRPLRAEGAVFVIHANGAISGVIGGRALSGSWFWRDGFFCRRAFLDGADLGLDCELIE
jgi:hypothetical protein